MSRYDRHYDFGMRGYRETTQPLMRGRGGPSGYDRGYGAGGPPPMRYGGEYLPNRVTARYNMDYITDRPTGYPRSYGMYGGDHAGRMGDDRMYRRPYITNGGTWTMRGSTFPIGYDYPDYGPNYGGRYPDEL